MAGTHASHPRHLPPLRPSPGEVDELERMAAVASMRRNPQRSRAVLGLLLVLVITLTVGLVCARGERLATPIDPTHVMPVR
jgi:hypothetical protein